MLQTNKIVLLLGIGSLAWSGCATVVPLSPPPISTPAVAQTVIAIPSPTPAPEPRKICLVTGGDVLPGCFLDPFQAAYGFDYPYQKIAPFFQAADIGLVNLECPLSFRGKKVRKKEFTFRVNPQAAQALKRAGINAVSLGNNHILDFGVPALLDTIDALAATNIAYAGAGKNLPEARRPARLILQHDQKVAILSYSLTFPASFWAGAKKPGTALARLPELEADIRSATAQADWTVVCFHWGRELQTHPTEYQIEYGHAAIDFGADVVVGTHPHVLQGIEWYKNRPILYSLGNLAFGGGKSRKSVDSVLVKINLDTDHHDLQAWVLPISVNNLETKFVPSPLEGAAGKLILQNLQSLSGRWNTVINGSNSGWAQVLPPAGAPVLIGSTPEHTPVGNLPQNQ